MDPVGDHYACIGKDGILKVYKSESCVKSIPFKTILTNAKEVIELQISDDSSKIHIIFYDEDSGYHTKLYYYNQDYGYYEEVATDKNGAPDGRNATTQVIVNVLEVNDNYPQFVFPFKIIR